MSLIIKLTDKTFTGTLPKLYRDAAIRPSTLFCYDALVPFSYPPQDASGTTWVDLTPVNAPATIDPNCGWSNGITIPPGSGLDKIALPASGKFNGTEAGLLFIVWFKAAAQTSGVSSVAGCADNTASMCQYAVWSDSSVTDRYVIGFNGTSKNTTVAAGSIVQLAISAVKNGDGSYTYQTFQNGAALASPATVAGPLKIPTGLPQLGYLGGAFGPSWEGTFYRCLMASDGTNGAAIIAADYAANSGRFI